MASALAVVSAKKRKPCASFFLLSAPDATWPGPAARFIMPGKPDAGVVFIHERNFPGKPIVTQAVSQDVQDQLFKHARTHSAWQPREVSDELLHQLYDLLKWGPTSANGSHGRFVFL